MKVKRTLKGKKSADGDKELRLRELLYNSNTPEEALLKRCSHFDLQGNALSAEAACEGIVDLRQTQLEECLDELKKEISVSFVMYRKMCKKVSLLIT
jgi:hypothetical protein